MIYLLAIFFIGTTLVLPVFFDDFFVAHDLLFHLNWNKFFADQFWAGDLYPRWLAGMNGGLGSPAFFFYGPIPFYAASIFKPFLANDPQGWLRLGLAYSLALVLSGIFTYLWLKIKSDKKTAFIGSIFYMLLPYHLQAELFYRFGFAEFWAFVWMPLALYAATEIAHGVRGGCLKLSVSYALLIMTHLPTTLLFFPIPLLYALTIADRGERLRTAAYITSGMVLGVCLSAIYLLPAMLTQDNVFLSRMTEGRGGYDKSFLISGETLQPTIKDYWRFLSSATLLTAFVAGVFSIPSCLNNNPINKRIGMLWVAVAMGALFMMYPWAEPVWKAMPVLQKIQFPWRFNVILSVAATALVATGLYSLKHKAKRYERLADVFVCAIIGALAIIAVNLIYERSSNELQPEELAAISHSLRFNEGAPEYLPRGVPDGLVSTIAAREMNQSLPQVQVVAGGGIVRILQWQPRRIELFVVAKEKMLVAVGQFFYPGWKAQQLNGKTPLQLEESQNGTLQLQIPEGGYHIRLTLVPSLSEEAGQWISLLSLILLIALGFHVYGPARATGVSKVQ